MRSSTTDWLGRILAFLVVLFIAGGAWWFFVAFWTDGDDRTYKWFFQILLERGFFPGGINPFQFTWLFWLCAAIVAAVGSSMSRPGYGGGSTVVSSAFAGIAAVLVVVCAIVFYVNINDHSGSYAGSTTFVVESTEKTPPSLKRLVSDTTPDKTAVRYMRTTICLAVSIRARSTFSGTHVWLRLPVPELFCLVLASACLTQWCCATA